MDGGGSAESGVGGGEGVEKQMRSPLVIVELFLTALTKMVGSLFLTCLCTSRLRELCVQEMYIGE